MARPRRPLPKLRTSSALRAGLLVLAPLLVAGQLVAQQPAAAPAGRAPANAAEEAAELRLREVPHPELADLEPEVAAQLQESLTFLRGVLEDSERDAAEVAQAYGELGRLYLAYDLLTPAAAAFNNAAVLGQGAFQWLYLLGYTHLQQGDLSQADLILRTALQRDSWSIPAMARLGEVYLAQGRVEEARPLYERILQAKPGAAAAEAALGQIALSRRDFTAAAAYLESALRKVPDATRLHHPLGLAYRGLGRMDEAREQLGKRGAVGVRIDDPWVDSLAELKTGERTHLLRGQLAFRAGRYPEAVESFRKAVEARPEAARARINLASALVQLGAVEEAGQQLAEALRLEPDNVTAHYNLGVLYSRAGRPDLALQHLARAVDANPRDAQAHLELGQALRAVGRGEDAATILATAVTLEPMSGQAQVAAAGVLVDLGRYADARSRLEDAYALLPRDPRVVEAYARLLAGSPDRSVRDGVEAYAAASRLYTARPTVGAAETLAMALAELGRCDDAREYLDKAANAAASGGDAAAAERLRAPGWWGASQCGEGSETPPP